MQIAPCSQGMNIKFEIFIATFHGRIQIAVKTRRQLTGSMRRCLERNGEGARKETWREIAETQQQADKTQIAKQSSKETRQWGNSMASKRAKAPGQHTHTHTHAYWMQPPNTHNHAATQWRHASNGTLPHADAIALLPRRGTLLLHTQLSAGKDLWWKFNAVKKC